MLPLEKDLSYKIHQEMNMLSLRQDLRSVDYVSLTILSSQSMIPQTSSASMFLDPKDLVSNGNKVPLNQMKKLKQVSSKLILLSTLSKDWMYKHKLDLINFSNKKS